jgi:hypothetical protein
MDDRHFSCITKSLLALLEKGETNHLELCVWFHILRNVHCVTVSCESSFWELHGTFCDLTAAGLNKVFIFTPQI